MTERLSALLHDEADHLDVPPPAAADVLTRGRSLRRRRRLTVALAGVSTAAVVGLGLAVVGGDGGDRAVDPAAPESGSGPVFSIGAEVYLDGGATRATVDDAVVKSLYYTSAGVVVRHGENPYSDGGGPQRFSLVAPDGTVSRLGVETEETVHATDPSQPYLVYAQRTGGTVEVVVHDVTTDREAARLPVAGLTGDWFPVALDGDTVYVGDGGPQTWEVDWRSGEVARSETVSGNPEVAGGRVVERQEGSVRVLDVATGRPVLEIPTKGYAWLDLSPDGRLARIDTESMERETGPTVYDVATGEHVTLEGPASDWGWTAGGDLFRVDGSELTVCDGATGACSTEPVELVREPADGDHAVAEICDADGNCVAEEPEDFSGELKLGGLTYES